MTVYFSELCFIDLDQISCDISAVPSASFSTFLQNFEKNDLGKDLRNIQGNKKFEVFWVDTDSGEFCPRGKY